SDSSTSTTSSSPRFFIGFKDKKGFCNDAPAICIPAKATYTVKGVVQVFRIIFRTKMRLKKTLHLILVMLATHCGAQQYFFRNYSVESGLPFVQVFCMYQ